MKRFIYFTVLLSVSLITTAQYPDFTSPINIPIILNGNFGEIRGNHFHAGIDIKTNSTKGLPISAIQDGTVSRISVSPSGYGNVIYIDHTSGYTSVYGHLDKFTPEIQKWVKEQQYKQQSFEVNLEPKADQFMILKGEKIAFSGNSGSSAGPHLHFEIRKTETQHAVNPLLLGYNIKDTSKPVVGNLYVYPLSDESNIQNSNKKQKFNLVLINGSYHLKAPVEILKGWGEIGFGVDACDYLDGNGGKCGIYKLELWVDSLLINTFALDELEYDKMRQMNSHVDYEESIKSKKKVHKTFIEPGNKMSIYKDPINRGIYNFDDGKKHKVKIVLFDARLNKSEILFTIQSTNKISFQQEEFTSLFRFDKSNEFECEDVKLNLPEEAISTDVKFKYKMIPGNSKTYSNIHRLHNNLVPLNKYADIKIKPTNLPDQLKDKALIAIIDIPTNSFSSLGGEYSFGWVKTTTRVLGDMCVVVDTVAPKITPLSITENKTLSEAGQIRFRISDNLSGIKQFNGYIDDVWVLFEYDAKNNLITYHFDEYIKKGKQHKLKLVVTDQKENQKEYKATFNY
jgi:hypothetical protein